MSARRSDVISIILGGGRGSRLDPLTKRRAKPAVPLGGKHRLIDIPISNCINSGFTSISVLTQFLSVSLHWHVYLAYQFDVFSGGFVELLPAEQTLTSTDWYQGTADAVRRHLERFRSRNADDALILSGDHLYRMDYSQFVDAHRQHRADVTISALAVTAEEAGRFGLLKTDPEHRIVEFREKPTELGGLESVPGSPRPYLASMGVYVFRMEVLTRLLENTPGEDFGRHIIPKAIEELQVYAYPFEGYWVDIGTISSFYEANLALTGPEPSFDFYDPNHRIYTRPRFLPSSVIDDCRLARTVVAEGSRLYQSEFDECVVGLRSVVSEGSHLRQVVMLGADFYEGAMEKAENRRLGRPDVGIGAGSRIERAIIDKNARIGRGVIIRPQTGQPDRTEANYSIRDGIVVIPKDAVLEDGTEIQKEYES